MFSEKFLAFAKSSIAFIYLMRSHRVYSRKKYE